MASYLNIFRVVTCAVPKYSLDDQAWSDHVTPLALTSESYIIFIRRTKQQLRISQNMNMIYALVQKKE